MYSRIITPPAKSFFLFGPRGTGKTTWIKTEFPNSVYLDLLESDLYTDLLARPARLIDYIPRGYSGFVILDEVQRIPALLYEAHRLIEHEKMKFILTGSSARKLRGKEVNLLAGRALTYHMHPLVAQEIKNDFDIVKSLKWGHLPASYQQQDPSKYLASYTATYLREEVQQEGLTRNIGAFSRFLEAASFSQGQVLNISEIARECAVNRKTVEYYFSILDDLLIAYRLPVFHRRAKRRMVEHPKFFFFDVGVYRALRPRGPLDVEEEIAGAGLETLIFQEINAMNNYRDWGYGIYYWRTANGIEVDFVLYGARGLVAIEVKRADRITDKHLNGLNALISDYPMAKPYLLYGGARKMRNGKIDIIPITEFIVHIYLKT